MNQEEKVLVEQIRSQYLEQEQKPSAMEELKALDAKVKLPATVFAYSFGILGTIVMGAGMSLIMTDLYAFFGLTNGLVAGIVVGVLGMVMVGLNWPIYNAILDARKKKYAAQILELSDKLLQK